MQLAPISVVTVTEAEQLWLPGCFYIQEEKKKKYKVQVYVRNSYTQGWGRQGGNGVFWEIPWCLLVSFGNSLSQIPVGKVTAGILQWEILRREKPLWLPAITASPWWHLSKKFPDLRKSHPMTRSSHREQTQELDAKSMKNVHSQL